MAEKIAYSQAAGSGRYDKSSGRVGKYDNVRRFWEDQVTAIFLRPALNARAARKRERGEGFRVLDLGCGSGDGFDLVTGIRVADPDLSNHSTTTIDRDFLEEYLGIDVNRDLLKQAATYYGGDPKLRFSSADLSRGLPDEVRARPAFDLYLTSYGTLSHFHDEQLVKLIADIARHAADGSLFMGDWLGRYSYEWQDLWQAAPQDEYFMDYRISYIYPEEEREQAEIPSFPLRLMNDAEILALVEQASADAGVEIRPLRLFDRSVLVGRHLETGEYNGRAVRTRAAVNSLFERYVRTDLRRLLVDYVPRAGFDELNRHFEDLFRTWNALIGAVARLLKGYDRQAGACRGVIEPPADAPEVFHQTLEAMRRIIEGTGSDRWGDARANMIEPQLGFCLRELELSLQKGTGTGHGLVGIFEIRK